jgi:hypothetical protein
VTRDKNDKTAQAPFSSAEYDEENVSMLPGTTVRYGANGGVTPDVTFDPNSHALYVR